MGRPARVRGFRVTLPPCPSTFGAPSPPANETKAEAFAAVAEAQILAGRLAQDKSRASTLARTRESLAKAEEQLGLGNYGAAIFFALRAQHTATRSTQEARR